MMLEPISDSPLLTARPIDSEASVTPIAPTAALRVWWALTGITVVLWGLDLFGFVDTYPWVSLLVVGLVVWGLGTVVASLYPKVVDPRLAGALAWVTVGMVVGAFVVWAMLQIITAPGYGTDEIAFDQYAAQLVAHGMNPYTHSMAPAFPLFHVSPDGYTFQLDGTPVTSLSYPALSFLFYVPFVALGWTTQCAVILNVLAWALGIVIAFALLPRPYRPLALLAGSLGIYISYAVGGATDALFVPLLIGAVYRWDSFVTARGLAAWRGPILLGLAMGVKQTPWLLLPFFVAAIAIEAGRRTESAAQGLRTAARYFGIALAAFLLPNLVFLAADPSAWMSGVLTPITSHAVPAGQGLVELSLFLGLGGGSLSAFSLGMVVVFVSLLATYVVTYPAMKPLTVVLPALVLFFSARSFGSYFVTLLPAAIVAACTIHPVPTSSEGAAGTKRNDPRVGAPMFRYRKWVVAGGVAASMAVFMAVLLYAPPLSIDITSVRTSGQLATVVELGLSVTNNAGSDVSPHFTIESGGTLTSFWVTRGPRKLAPGENANYVLLAPNFYAQPPISGGFQVVAFTSHPDSVSRSGTYRPTIWHVSLVPSALNSVVPIGTPVTIHAELLNALDAPVTVAGQPIYLGQIIYAQEGLRKSRAVINGSAPGQTPVVAYTNAKGVATFVVSGTQPGDDSVYFEANLVNLGQFYPYGYSDPLPIRFGPR
jgi:hypothetical protein